jgi:hypothetical protein
MRIRIRIQLITLMWIRIQIITVMRLRIRIHNTVFKVDRRYTNALLLSIFSVLAIQGYLMVIFCLRYLHKLFTQLSKHKGKLKVRHLPIEDVTASLPHHLEVSLVVI